jgi:hypothetical protein
MIRIEIPRDVATGQEEDDRLWNSPIGKYVRQQFKVEAEAVECQEWVISSADVNLSSNTGVDQFLVTLVNRWFTHPTDDAPHWETPGSTLHCHTLVLSVWTIGYYHHQLLSDNTYTFPNLVS